MSIRLVGDMVPLLPEIDENDRSGAIVRRVCNVEIDGVQYGIAVRRRVIHEEPVLGAFGGWESVLMDSDPSYQVEAYSYVRGEYPGKPDSAGIVPFLTFYTTWDRNEAFEQFASTHSILRGLCSGPGLYDFVAPVMIGHRLHETGSGLPYDLWRVVKRQTRQLFQFVTEGW